MIDVQDHSCGKMLINVGDAKSSFAFMLQSLLAQKGRVQREKSVRTSEWYVWENRKEKEAAGPISR